MNTNPEWKRNLDALSSFLGPTGPTGASSSAQIPEVTLGSELLRALAAQDDGGSSLDLLAEKIGGKYAQAAGAAKSLEAARLITVDWSAVVPVARLTAAGRQIASATVAVTSPA